METTRCSRCKKQNDNLEFKTCNKCREWRKIYSAQRRRKYPKIRKPRSKGVTCGRRHCGRCGHWRHISDFAVAKWTDPIAREEAQYFRHMCRTCERLEARVKNAERAGRSEPYGQRQLVGLTPEKRAARRRELRNEWQRRKLKEDPVWAENYREKQRFYAERRRRELGVPVRKNYVSTYQKASESELLDIKPFQQWIEDRLQYYETIEDFAAVIDTSPRAVLRWRTGRERDKRGKERIITKVPLNTVDIAITREGNTGLWEIYPDLYE